MVKIIFKCEHCFSFYENKNRTKRCCEKLVGKDNTIISKYEGEIKRKGV